MVEDRQSKEINLIMSQIDRMLLLEGQKTGKSEKEIEFEKNFDEMKLFFDEPEQMESFGYVMEKQEIAENLKKQEMLGFEEEDEIFMIEPGEKIFENSKNDPKMKDLSNPNPNLQFKKEKQEFISDEISPDQKQAEWLQLEQNLKQIKKSSRDEMQRIQLEQSVEERTKLDSEVEQIRGSWMRLDNQVINAHVYKNKLGLLLDVGSDIYHSGQKKRVGWGSMSEHVCASILKKLGVIDRAKERRELRVFDPFMGSGTFLLEALFGVLDYPKEAEKVTYIYFSYSLIFISFEGN